MSKVDDLVRRFPWLVLEMAKTRYPRTVTTPDGSTLKITPLYRDGTTLRRAKEDKANG